MAIQMRRGNFVDFNPAKMLPGEWAVSTDADTAKQVVWMCFQAGVVKRMGTLEDFDADIQEIIQDYLDSIAESVNQCTTSATNAKQSEDNSYKNMTDSELYKNNSFNSAIESRNYSELAQSYLNSIENDIDNIYGTVVFIENYIDVLDDLSSLHPIVDTILDSSGNNILDSMSMPISSQTYVTEIEFAIRQAQVAYNLAENLSKRVSDIETWKNNLIMFPQDNSISDSSGNSILDGNGNVISGRIMLLAI